MTKAQLIDKVAKETGISKKDVVSVCDALFDTITASLASGESAQLSGFGVFVSKERPARTCRNPKTGEPVEVEASRSVTFTASKTLKEKVNETR